MSSQRYDEISTRSLEPDSTRPDSLTPGTPKTPPPTEVDGGAVVCAGWVRAWRVPWPRS